MSAESGTLRTPWWIAAWFVVYLILAAVLPAVDDEVYYWCWSKDLQWSYFDHPPMVAVLIRLSTRLFGDTTFGYRVPACIASAFCLFVIDRLTVNKLLVWGVALSPLFTFGAILMTPDSPLILFWSAYLWWLVGLHDRLAPRASLNSSDAMKSLEDPPYISVRYWVFGGILLGCGVLSKYTMGLAVPTAFISLLISRQSLRRWLPGYVLHGIISFLVALPILIYNIGQNFEPLRFQWEHVAERTPSSLRSLGDFVGVQLLLFGTLPFVLLPWVLWNVRRLTQTPRLRVCACLYALPLLFFIYKSTQTRLEGNWALVCFISFWPLASDWFDSVRQSRSWQWWTAASFIPPVLAVLLLTIHLLVPLPIPAKVDRVHRQIALNKATSEIVHQIQEQAEQLPVYTDSYQMTSLLRFQHLKVNQIDQMSPRHSHFTRPPRHVTDVDRAYVVTERPLPEKFVAGFKAPELVAEVPVNFRGQTDRTLRVWLYWK